MSRRRLPNRRPNQTLDLLFEGRPYAVTIGYRKDGSPAEIFTHGAKIGSSMDLLLDDVSVALSLCLQHGVPAHALAASMGRQHSAPASIVGALVDLLASEAAA